MWDLDFKEQHVAVAMIDSGLNKKIEYESNIIEARDFSGHHEVRNRMNAHGTGMTIAGLTIVPKAEQFFIKT